jgi:hypothetical protein
MNGDLGQAAKFKDAYVVLKSMAPRVGDPFSVPATISETSLEDRISIDTDEMTMPEVV